VRKYDGSTFSQLLQIGPGLPGSADGQFNTPRGIYADSSNRLFVCDAGNNRIQIFDLSGNFLTKFGAAGSGAAQFNTPYDVTVFGSAGSAVISIADYSNRRISQWSG
jgi:DNA-binding beta-propeller fold protein YncE